MPRLSRIATCDLANAKHSQAGIVGLSDFEGGKLWIEDDEGQVKRRVTRDQVKTGGLLDISQQAKLFDSRRWHGADKHRGIRATLTVYTARQLHNLDRDLVAMLSTLGFQLPPLAKAEAPSNMITNDQHAHSTHSTHSTCEQASTTANFLASLMKMMFQSWGLPGLLVQGSRGGVRVVGWSLEVQVETLSRHGLHWQLRLKEATSLGSFAEEMRRRSV